MKTLQNANSLPYNKPHAQRQATHSPLPWHVCTLGETPFHTSNIVTNDGHPICNVQSYPHATTGKADAAFIVRACNNAERLAEALRDIRNAYQQMFDVMPVAWQTYDHIAESALAQWEAK